MEPPAAVPGADHALFGAEDTALLQRSTLGAVCAAGFDILLKQLFLSKHRRSPLMRLFLYLTTLPRLFPLVFAPTAAKRKKRRNTPQAAAVETARAE